MRVVVEYQPNAEGRTALSHGVREAALRNADLTVVVAADVDSAEVAADLSLATAHGQGAAVPEVRRLDSDRQVVEELVDLSYEEDVALIVLGLRRRSPVGKLFLGSTSQRVLLEAACPVQAVKPPVAPAG